MPNLIVMRHAEAEAARGRRDHARPLSRDGIAEAERAGRELEAEGLRPDLVLVSDSARTRATLDHVARAFPAPLPEQVLPPLYGASPATILAALAEVPPEVQTAMVIGHNPGLGDFARRFAEAGEAADLAALAARFPTACRAVLVLEGADWRRLAPGRLARLMGATYG